MLRSLTFGTAALALVWIVYLQESFAPSVQELEVLNPPERSVVQVETNLNHAATRHRGQSVHSESLEMPADDFPKAVVDDEVVVDDQVALARFELERVKAIQAAADHASTFRRAFESETRDAFWANDEEPSLRRILEAVEFSTEDVADIVCRRTVCQVTFKEPRVAEGRLLALQSRLGERYGDIALGPARTTHSEQHARLYVLRQDFALEAPRGD